VSCGDGTSECRASGAVCLIKRINQASYGVQTLNCETGGGVAALIYNNDPGRLVQGSVDTTVTIPSIGISGFDGEKLLSRFGETVSFGSENIYSEVSGTSFAAPFVSGTAAAVLLACPLCQGPQVFACLQTSARDLGASGEDDYHG